MVAKLATTMITARPSGGRIVPGNLIPANVSTRSPQPTESAVSTSGNTSQQAAIVTALSISRSAAS